MGARGLNGSQADPARIEKVFPNELDAANLMYFTVLPAAEMYNLNYFANSGIATQQLRRTLNATIYLS